MITEWLLCCFVLLFLTLLYKRINSGPLSKLPKIKTRWPFFSSGLDLSKTHLVLAEWSKQCGPIFRFSLYGEDIVVLNDYSTIYEALVTQGSALAGRPKMSRTDHVDRNKNSVVWQSYTSKLKFLRKHIHSSLRMYGSGLSELETRCLPELQQLITRIQQTGNRPFDPWSYLFDAVSNIMLDLTLGIRLNYEDGGLQQLKQINNLFNHTFGPGPSRVLDRLPWFLCKESQELKTLQTALNLRDLFWDRHRNKIGHNGGCVINNLEKLSHIRKYDDHDLSDLTLKETFTNLILAGTDTTTTTLTCLILVLLHKPDIQKRLHDEIDYVIGNSRPPSLSDKSSMPYLEACLLETLRFTSHVPLAVPHSTICDTEIAGYTVPKGTTVYVNLWALHHDETVWTDPWAFIPERFLDERGKLLPLSHETRRKLMVFSAGRRVCLGESLAKNRLFLFAASLLQHFEFSTDVTSDLPDMDPRLFSLGIVLHPAKFKVTASVRGTNLMTSHQRRENNFLFNDYSSSRGS